MQNLSHFSMQHNAGDLLRFSQLWGGLPIRHYILLTGKSTFAFPWTQTAQKTPPLPPTHPQVAPNTWQCASQHQVQTCLQEPGGFSKVP